MTAATAKTDITIEIAGVEHLDKLAPLFNAYRVFTGQAADVPASAHFLFERMINHESVIFMASDAQGNALGFVQLYMIFSSQTLEPMWILADLFVDEPHRRQGIGTALIRQAQTFVTEREDKGLGLQNVKENEPANRFFEAVGFDKVERFNRYFWYRAKS